MSVKSNEHYRLAYEWFKALDGDMMLKDIAKIVDANRRTLTLWRKTGKPPFLEKPYGTHPHDMTPEQLEIAERLLDDGASYSEVARTVGKSAHAIRNRFPGRGWTQDQINEYVSIIQKDRNKRKVGLTN